MSDSRFFQTIRLITLAIITHLLLTSCATRPPIQSLPTQTTDPLPTESEVTVSAKDLINQAVYETPDTAVMTLIKAAKLYISEQKYTQALWLCNQIPALTNTPDSLYNIALLKAEALYFLNKIDMAFNQLTIADNLHRDEFIAHGVFYYQLLSRVQYARNLSVDAIEAKLYALSLEQVDLDEESRGVTSFASLNPDPLSHDSLPPKDKEMPDEKALAANQALWQQLILLSDWQLNELIKRSPPQIKGWQQLLYFAHQWGDKNATFTRYLRQWQRNFPQHPAQAVVNILQQDVAPELVTIENIAVILPLSGRHQAAGQSAQQGLLAAFDNNAHITLHFIDSYQLDMANLPNTFNTLNIDHVIGPLLRPKVNEYLNQTSIALPTLLLNVPLNEQLPAHCVAFSMRPEDEAIQAASILSSRGFQQPVIFSHQDPVSQRMAAAFKAQWQKTSAQTPDIIYFDPQQNIQEQLKRSLDVNLSESRIRDLQARVEQSLETVPRSRRDLDMIYLIGSSNETRLLKPYIDVNTSPFADVIPIFASSRSHNNSSVKRDSRDLAGLVFTEIPWLLNSKQQNKPLRELNKTLWPQKSDGLQRIFAMGYDSFSVIQKMHLMKRHAYIRHYGQTGVLQLTADSVLTRSLLWGVYQQDRVESFVME